MLRVLPPLVLVLIGAVLMMPTNASAAALWSATDAETCGGFNATERGSGQMDALGRLYVPCSRRAAAERDCTDTPTSKPVQWDRGVKYCHDNYIAILNAAGQRGKVPLDFPPFDGVTDRASDVAPSPDGQYLYVIKYAEYTVYRFDRQTDDSYRVNTQWSLATFQPATPWSECQGQPCRPRGQFLATDANGDIYLSAGLWTCQAGSPHCTEAAIVKYGPAGNVLTRFGRQVYGSFALGESHGQFGGIAVTANGARVFVTDINNNRVQRFDRDGAGYVPRLDMGRDEEPIAARAEANHCYEDAVRGLSAPYDLAMSVGGEILVINTSCYSGSAWQGIPGATADIHRYSQDGVMRGTIRGAILGDHRVHGIAVDRANNVHLIQAKAMLRPAAGWSDAGADIGGGGPMGGTAAVDATAPVITAISVTPATTTGRDVTVGITATDAVGVVQLRIREDGVQGAWRAYATSIPYVITERIGAHELVVEVRDAAGNVSAARAVTVTRVAPTPPPTNPTNPTPANPTQPANPAQPTQPTQPAGPTQPANAGGGTVEGGGGGAPAVRPEIMKVTMPVQVFRGNRINVTIRARGIGGVTHVRFSTAGTRWGAWRTLRGARRAASAPSRCLPDPAGRASSSRSRTASARPPCRGSSPCSSAPVASAGTRARARPTTCAWGAAASTSTSRASTSRSTASPAAPATTPSTRSPRTSSPRTASTSSASRCRPGSAARDARFASRRRDTLWSCHTNRSPICLRTSWTGDTMSLIASVPPGCCCRSSSILQPLTSFSRGFDVDG